MSVIWNLVDQSACRVKHRSLDGFRKNLQCSLNQGENKEIEDMFAGELSFTTPKPHCRDHVLTILAIDMSYYRRIFWGSKSVAHRLDYKLCSRQLKQKKIKRPLFAGSLKTSSNKINSRDLSDHNLRSTRQQTISP